MSWETVNLEYIAKLSFWEYIFQLDRCPKKLETLLVLCSSISRITEDIAIIATSVKIHRNLALSEAVLICLIGQEKNLPHWYGYWLYLNENTNGTPKTDTQIKWPAKSFINYLCATLLGFQFPRANYQYWIQLS